MGIKKKTEDSCILNLPPKVLLNYLPKALTSEPIIFEMYVGFIQNVHHYTDAKIITI